MRSRLARFRCSRSACFALVATVASLVAGEVGRAGGVPSFARTPLSIAGEHPAACFADIDDDGDVDVFIGVESGDVEFVENTGDPTAAFFAPPVENPFGLADVGDGAIPFLADIDGDADLDASMPTATSMHSSSTGTTTRSSSRMPEPRALPRSSPRSRARSASSAARTQPRASSTSTTTATSTSSSAIARATPSSSATPGRRRIPPSRRA